MQRKNSEPNRAFSRWNRLLLDDDRRPHWQRLTQTLRALGATALTGRADEARRLLHETGVSYNPASATRWRTAASPRACCRVPTATRRYTARSRSCAPCGATSLPPRRRAVRDDPALALLTPGARKETYFEQALLAEKLGLQLVEGSDLAMHSGRLQLRAPGGLTLIDVRWRRVTAQTAVTPVPTPSFGGKTLDMRPVPLRTFLTAGNDGYRVLPGGFARIAPQADTLFISNQAGAMGKDVWVLASEPETDTLYLASAPVVGTVHGGLPRRTVTVEVDVTALPESVEP